MLLACLALGLFACHDDALAPQRIDTTPVPRFAATGPVVAAQAACTLSFTRGKGTIHCGPTGATAAAVATMRRAHPDAVASAFGPYVFLFPNNLVKDTVRHMWSFDTRVQNLLGQPIGTVDGTTVLGTKVFVTGGPDVTGGTGTVTIANADGSGTFTAPNQAFWAYPEITAPQALTAVKTWRFNVPNTVTSINMNIAVSIDMSAEQNVALTAPSTTPTWFRDDSSRTGGFFHNIVSLEFRANTTIADRQLAVAYLGGTVVGGDVPDAPVEGTYYVLVSANGSADQLNAFIAKAEALPQIRMATFPLVLEPQYLRPKDGTGWRQWHLSPDSLGISSEVEMTWPLEAINAPFAWGCTTGDTTAHIAVLDAGFDSTEVMANVVGTRPEGLNTSPSPHGSWMANIIAAPGNNGQGMTGVMWKADLELRDIGNGEVKEVVNKIVSAGFAGVKVLNLSYGKSDWRSNNPRHLSPWVPNAIDSTTLAKWYDEADTALRPLLNDGRLPLVVLPAGDSSLSAYYTMLAGLRSHFPENFVVVSGSERVGHTRWPHSGFGSLVDIAAPADTIWTLDHTGLVPTDGTSMSAAFVSGVAGLLRSFDPTLTAKELKALLVNGAAAGGRLVQRDEAAGATVPLLNAYESLKLAAQRPGAPLCANDVWITGGQLFARRDTATVETLASGLPTPAWGTTVMHGGHHVQFATNDGTIEHLLYQAGEWKSGGAQSSPDTIPGGTARSAEMFSHDGDTAAVAEVRSGDVDPAEVSPDSETVFLSVGPITPAGSFTSSRDTSISYPIGIPGDHVCITVPGQESSCQQFPRKSGIWSVTGAYASRGNRFWIIVNRFTAATQRHDTMVLDDRGVPTPSVDETYDYTPAEADIYEFQLPAMTVTKTVVPSEWVYWTGLAETGERSVSAFGAETLHVDINKSDLTRRTVMHCAIEYRDGHLAGTSTVVAAPDACEDMLLADPTLIASGTIAPRRVGPGKTHTLSLARLRARSPAKR